MSCLFVAIGPTRVLNHSRGNNGLSCGQKNGGLYKYLSRINVSYLSLLFWSVYFHMTGAPNQMHIPVKNTNIKIIFATSTDSEERGNQITPNGKHI